MRPFGSLVSLTQNRSSKAASPLSGVEKSRFFHGKSRKTYPISATVWKGRWSNNGRLWDWVNGVLVAGVTMGGAGLAEYPLMLAVGKPTGEVALLPAADGT